MGLLVNTILKIYHFYSSIASNIPTITLGHEKQQLLSIYLGLNALLLAARHDQRLRTKDIYFLVGRRHFETLGSIYCRFLSISQCSFIVIHPFLCISFINIQSTFWPIFSIFCLPVLSVLHFLRNSKQKLPRGNATLKELTKKTKQRTWIIG